MRTLLLTAVAASVLAATAAGVANAPIVLAKIKLAGAPGPCATAAGGGFVWVSEYSRPYLLRINPKTNKVVGTTPIGNGSCGLGYGAGSLWIEDTNSSTVSRVSTRTRKRVAAIKVGIAPYDAIFAYGSAWVTAHVDGEVERIDPARNRVVKRVKVNGAIGVVAAFGSVWGTGNDGVVRIDPATNKVLATIPVDGGAGWTAASTDAVWVTTGTSALARIDPQTNSVAASVQLPKVPLGDPDVIGGDVWVPVVRKNEVVAVDPATNTISRTFRVGLGPFVVTQIHGQAWIPSWHGSDIWRLRP